MNITIEEEMLYAIRKQGQNAILERYAEAAISVAKKHIDAEKKVRLEWIEKALKYGIDELEIPQEQKETLIWKWLKENNP